MNKMLVVVLAIALCSGCAQYQAAIAHRGAQLADDSLRAASYAASDAATAGALERKYQLFSNPNGPKAKAWRLLFYHSDETVIEPEPAPTTESNRAGDTTVAPPAGYVDLCQRQPGHQLCRPQ